MNAQSHRLVFNPARACLVAVAETARGCGKSGSVGGTRARRRKRVSTGRCTQNRPLAPVEWARVAIKTIVSITSGSRASDPTAGTTLPLPAPDLRTVQGAWAELMAHQVAPVLTDWKALNAQAGAINTTNLTLNLTGTLTNGGGINATSTLKITAAGGIDNSAGLLSAGEWVELGSQGLGLINNGGTIQSGGSLKANVTGNISAVGGHFVSTHSDVVLDASGKLTLTDSVISAKEGVAHLYGSEGVTIAATQQTKTSVTTQAQFQTVEHAAVAQAGDNDAQAAYTEVIAGSGSTTTTTTTQWADSTVDANKIDIQSSKGGVTIDASDLKAANGIRVSAAQDVNILAQRGVANSATTTITASQQSVGSGWDGDGTQKQLVTTTAAGGSSNQETLRASSLNAGAGTLSIESTGGNISGQSAQLSGKKIVLLTTKTQDGTAFDKVDGKPIAATAGGGSINLESLQVSGRSVSAPPANAEWSAMTTQTLTTVKGTLNATGDGKDGGITISANKDLALGAIALDAGQGHVLVQAGGNVNLNANADAVQTNQTHNGGSSSFFTTTTTVSNYQTQDVNASVTAIRGNDITLKAGDTLTNYAANIDGKGTVLQIAGNSALNYTATQSRSYSEDSKSSTSILGLVNIGHETSTTTALNTVELGSKIFGKQVGIQAKDVVIKGSDVVAQDLLSIKATDSVSITAATNTVTTQHDESKSMLGISGGLGKTVTLNSTSSALHTKQDTTTSSASNVSGGSVVITSGGDTTVTASNVVATKDVTITANGGNINILAATNTDTTSSKSESNTTSLGLFAGGSGRETIFAHTTTAGNGQGSSTTQTTSMLSANTGTLSLVSGGKITTQGAELLAQDAVNLTAQSMDLQAVQNASTSANHFESNSFTVGAALSGTLGSKITAIGDLVELATSTSNDRLKGAATLKAGYDAYKLVSGGIGDGTKAASSFQTNLTDASKTDSTIDASKGDPNSGSAFGISISVANNSSKQDSSSATSNARGTNIQAKAINLTATQGDITATGAKLQADNISLDAAKNINLLAAVNSTDLKSSNESHSLGGGVTVGVGQQSGISFQFNAGQANGNTNGAEVTFDNTLVTATNKLTVKSGGNTNLIGAQLGGNSVTMDVGGDLTIFTLQDQSNFKSEQHSSGIALSVCVPPICYGTMVSGSVSKSDSTIDHNYQSATGQSGIAAGAGGYAITVKGNTDLKGGAITSAAPADKNSLSTASITSSDLNNAQNTNSQSSSISLSYSGSASALSNLATNATNNALAALSSGGGMPANGSSSGTTQSVISKGTVTITGTGDATKDANSNTQVAALTDRDATKANGSLKNTLTLQQAQLIPAAQQKATENAQAANLAGAAMDGMIGDLKQSNKWPSGSTEATILHGFSGLIQATLGGTNAATGFASGALNEQAVTAMGSYLESQGIKRTLDGKPDGPLNPTYAELMKAGSTLLGVGTVAALGGTKADVAAGANIAKNGTEFNYLKHVEATALSDAKKRQAACADNACTLQEQKKIDALLTTSNDRDVALQQACSGDPSGATCKTLTADAKRAFESYSGKPDVILDNTVAEQAALAKKAFNHPTLAAGGTYSPKTTGAINGVLKSLAAGPAGVLIISNTVANALTGDTQAQQSLKQMVIDAAVTITNIPAAIQRQLDAADAAEARGDIQKATEIRAELVTNTILVTGAATKLALSSGASSVFKQGEKVLTPGEVVAQGANGGVPSGIGNGAGTGETVTVFRVQGGTPPLASRQLITVDESGNPVINRTTLNISIGDPAHAEYFLSKRPGANVTSFDVPKWMGNFIDEQAIPQAGYRTNPANQGGLAPKVVDPTTPGRSYELPDIWAKWLEEVAVPGSGKVKKGGTP